MRRLTSWPLVLSLAVVLAGCLASTELESRGGSLAGDDAGPDAGPPVPVDASPDAAPGPVPVPGPPSCGYGRCVRGLVTAPDGTPAGRVPVLLEDRATLQIRSYLTTPTGEYRFQGLSTERDYELSARASDGSRAEARIDRWDGRTDLVLDLRLR